MREVTLEDIAYGQYGWEYDDGYGRHTFLSREQRDEYIRMRDVANEAMRHGLGRKGGRRKSSGDDVGILTILINIILLPFTILFLRDTTQWWLGTGKHSKDR